MAISLSHLLARSARSYPHAAAVAVGADTVHTYEQLAGRVARLAEGLRNTLGLDPDDRVALFMTNCAPYVELLLACWHAGLAAVPINARLHSKELEFILADSGARVCFVTPDHEADASSAAGAGVKAVINVVKPEYERLLSASACPAAERAADDVAWLFYTSGTTGRPKGVMITHRNLLAMTLNYFSDVDTIAPGEAILHAAPMSHGSGLYIVPHVAHAAVNVIPESGGFDPREILELLPHHPGVTVFAAPTMVKRLVGCAWDGDTSNLKTVVYGGGPMYVEDCKAAMRRFGYRFAQIYGQGEAPMTITAMNKAIHADTSHPRYEARLASVGLPHTGMEVRIADLADRPLAVGEVGEILVRGDAVMRGYWANEAASAETLRGGWLHTGDVGSIDEEGFLTLKDRSKDVIISGGANVYPREVEEVLLRHAAVSEVAVVGETDAEWGETVVAFVVPSAGATIDAGELDALCLANIARFKRPRRYEVLDALPKNLTGKVLKTELRKLLR